MKLGIIVGSVREGRNGEAVGKWVLDFASNRNDGNEYELVELANYDLPFLGKTPTEAQGAAIQAWSEKMASFDGYIMVTPEYNRLIPGAFNNAMEFLKPEVANKPVGFVAYGGLGGLSSIQSFRLIAAELQMASVRTMVTFSIMTDFVNMSEFKPAEYHAMNANEMLDQVSKWAKALKTIR